MRGPFLTAGENRAGIKADMAVGKSAYTASTAIGDGLSRLTAMD
jgi:hypothetical protein